MKKLLFFLFTVCFITACEDNIGNSENGEQEKTYDPRRDIALTSSEAEISTANIDFAFRLFKAMNSTLSKEESEQLVVSPLSAALALSMTANGAAGETQQEIIDALGFEGFHIDDVNTFNQKLVNALLTLDSSTKLHFANSFWMANDLSVLDSFTQSLAGSYDAVVKNVDFSQPSTVEEINYWCADKTNGTIPKFLTSVPTAARFMLLNALYFEGE